MGLNQVTSFSIVRFNDEQSKHQCWCIRLKRNRSPYMLIKAQDRAQFTSRSLADIRNWLRRNFPKKDSDVYNCTVHLDNGDIFTIKNNSEWEEAIWYFD
jgi:hypothetical protein